MNKFLPGVRLSCHTHAKFNLHHSQHKPARPLVSFSFILVTIVRDSNCGPWTVTIDIELSEFLTCSLGYRLTLTKAALLREITAVPVGYVARWFPELVQRF
jgi:hypothetical protein